MRFAYFAVAIVASTAVSGCLDRSRGRVHGVVTVAGKPLANATIIFIASDNKTHLAALKPDGSFEVGGVSYGAVKVSIQADLPKVAPRPDPTAFGAGKGMVFDEKAKAVRPPASADTAPSPPVAPMYVDPEMSGLSFELKEPDREWSVDLKK